MPRIVAALHEKSGNWLRPITSVVVAEAVFYFDFNSPYAYLAAQRIDDLVPDAEWKPFAFAILLTRLGTLEERLVNLDTAPIVAEVDERVASRGLPPFAPPEAWPVQSWSLTPLRAALVADELGRLREFSLAAFHKSFVESRSLAELDNVLAAARDAELDPGEIAEGIQRPEIKERLKANTEEALARGVTGIPTVAIGDDLFWGDDRLEEAAARASTA
jgi:2-hydroxychromene-2-carboxylate isomerase